MEKLQHLLDFAAESQHHRGLVVYLLGKVDTPCKVTYEELRVQATHNEGQMQTDISSPFDADALSSARHSLDLTT